MFQKIGFIGTGNMGSALAAAVHAKQPDAELMLSNRNPEKAEALAARLPGARAVGNADIAKHCDLIFLGVKPQVLPGVLSDLWHVFSARSSRFVLVSMAAGVSLESIAEKCPPETPVFRIMPNTPVEVGKGVIQICGHGVKEEEFAAFEELLSSAGLTDRVSESAIDAASALSGCGPAFVYMLLEALADGAVACGLPRKTAQIYAAAMTEGAARLALERGGNTGALKDAVCSPGGTTIEGVRVLEEAGFRAAAMDAVIAAYEKTLELR